MVVRNRVWIFEVEIVSSRFNLFRRNLPCDVAWLSPLSLGATPPFDTRFEVLHPNRLRHRICFLSIGYSMLVKPDLFRRLSLLEEQQVSANARVRLKDAVREAHYRVEIALFHQGFLQTRLHAFSEEASVGKDHASASARLEEANNQRKK